MSHFLISGIWYLIVGTPNGLIQGYMDALHGLKMTLVANHYLHVVCLVVYLGFVCRDFFWWGMYCEKSRHIK